VQKHQNKKNDIKQEDIKKSKKIQKKIKKVLDKCGKIV
jgi:hypothetical protein